MKLKTIAFITVISSITTVNAAEQNVDKSGFWLGAAGGMGISTDSDITGNESSIEVLSPRLEMGYNFDQNFGVYGNYDYMHNFGDANLHLGTLGLKGNVYFSENLSLFGKIGATYIYVDDSKMMDDSFSGTVGIGLEYQLTNAVTTKLGYDYYNKLDTKNDRNIDFNQVYWGMTYKFGQPATPTVLREEIKVPVEVVKESIELSRSTYVLPYQVGNVGINNYGYYNLEEVITSMQTNPELTANIVGRTDSTGSMKANLRISGERAKNVAQYLMENGIAKERITVSGVANQQPLSQNADAQLERSVQIILQ
ncbi:TPA: OmpA family protein [Vibrio parahaemolyticus]|uniref:OmpA family protein n=1 Tax=Vibrio alginolyticus TaxID=663 RepID=UPI0014281408|nr:OmpA family protein [Vibrio alginolyticus]MDF4820392.1 OmpA family protein [Vibrio parahaemolyticus]QIR94036.1 OmpA family protein [Vibrio alginolyticus]HAV1327695.1 OmpA family protein [Vibrio parahaemolyticus]HBN6271658.1 OmpA family protein [Vibrio parahaemolyticus]